MCLYCYEYVYVDVLHILFLLFHTHFSSSPPSQSPLTVVIWAFSYDIYFIHNFTFLIAYKSAVFLLFLVVISTTTDPKFNDRFLS